jgi:hypothetical protein
MRDRSCLPSRTHGDADANVDPPRPAAHSRLAGPALALFALALTGCAVEDAAPADNTRDLRVELPLEVDGWRNIIGGEAIIAPGEEKMLCFHMTWDQPTMAVGEIDMIQGKMGHHAVMVTTKAPLPAGSVEDCTASTEMWKYNAFLIPVPSLPAGMGIELATGQHMVLQSHYVNIGDVPIKIRDVVRVRQRQTKDVQKWVSTLSASSFDIDVMPGASRTETFDCGFDEDVELILAGPHMHEEGTGFQIHLGPSVDKLELLQDVDDWIEEYRDSPPVLMAFDKPLAVPKGSILRTTCSWKNTRDHQIGFPEEMCTTFGYIAGTKKLYDCRKENGKITW